MWKVPLLAIVLSTAHAQVPGDTAARMRALPDSGGSRLTALWKPSLGMLAVASALDAHSSWSKCCEANPLLPSRDGRFGPGAAAVKGAALAGQSVFQLWAVRKWPRAAKPLAIMNFASAGLLTAVAVRNYGVPRGNVRR